MAFMIRCLLVLLLPALGCAGPAAEATSDLAARPLVKLSTRVEAMPLLQAELRRAARVQGSVVSLAGGEFDGGHDTIASTRGLVSILLQDTLALPRQGTGFVQEVAGGSLGSLRSLTSAHGTAGRWLTPEASARRMRQAILRSAFVLGLDRRVMPDASDHERQTGAETRSASVVERFLKRFWR